MTVPLQERIRAALERCRTVLGNMAQENEGAIFSRWPISHEPLRNDARNLLPIIDEAIRELAAQPADRIARGCPDCGCPEGAFHYDGCPRESSATWHHRATQPAEKASVVPRGRQCSCVDICHKKAGETLGKNWYCRVDAEREQYAAPQPEPQPLNVEPPYDDNAAIVAAQPGAPWCNRCESYHSLSTPHIDEVGSVDKSPKLQAQPVDKSPKSQYHAPAAATDEALTRYAAIMESHPLGAWVMYMDVKDRLAQPATVTHADCGEVERQLRAARAEIERYRVTLAGLRVMVEHRMHHDFVGEALFEIDAALAPKDDE